MPSIVFERGSRALPVGFRRCRSSARGDGSARGLVHRTDARLPVTAFVHVVDCRGGALDEGGAGADCSSARRGRIYIQYWVYYADSATLRGLPLIGPRAYHHDDWESVQIRVKPWWRGRRAGLLSSRLQLLGRRPELGVGRRHRPPRVDCRGGRRPIGGRLGPRDAPALRLGRQPRRTRQRLLRL
jgi:hypothetical protein